MRPVIALTVFFFLVTVPFTVLSSTIEFKDATTEDEDRCPSSSGPMPSYDLFSGSISIESDSDFTVENGVFSGSGTQSDPYVIENLSFDVGTVPAIKVANTTRHLIVRNVMVSEGKAESIDSVHFANCRNVTLAGSGIHNGSKGLYVTRCSAITVRGCVFESCSYGIWAVEADRFKVEDCSMDHNGMGCRITGPSNNCLVGKNRMRDNSCGFMLDGSFFGLDVFLNNISGNNDIGMLGDGLKGENIVVRENLLASNDGFGAFLEYCQVLNFTDNIVHENPSGGILGEGLYGRGVNISGNNVSGNGVYGMELQNVGNIAVCHNNVTQHSNIGIYLGSGSVGNLVMGNIVSGNYNAGILLGSGSDRNTIISNELADNNVGVYLEYSSDSSIKRCIFRRNGFSDVYITYGVDNELVGNEFEEVLFRTVFIKDAEGMTIGDNVAKGSGTHVLASGCKGIIFVGNDLTGPLTYFGLSNCTNAFASSNNFTGPGTNISISYCQAVTMVDNRFEDVSVRMENQYPGTVNWSLPEKEPMKNIIGGPYRYGNFWSDYRGEDIDGDGIGDTELPHGPGDVGPLVKDPPPMDLEPPIVHLVHGHMPATGEEWKGVFRVVDNRSMYGVVVPQASFVQLDRCGHVIEQISDSDIPLDYEGILSFSLEMDMSAVSLNVIIEAVDFSGNSRESEFDLTVKDTIPPQVMGTSYAHNVDAGDVFEFDLMAFDNVWIERVSGYCIFLPDENWLWIDGQQMNDLATDWRIAFTVPENATGMFLSLCMSDHDGNSICIDTTDVTVNDVVPPLLEDRTTGMPETGREFNMSFYISDNGEIRSILLLTSQDGVDSGHFLEDWLPYPWWVVTVDIWDSTKHFDYVLMVEDGAGNSMELRGGYSVIDTIPPTIKRLENETPRTGEPFEMAIAFHDNWGVYMGVLEWWIDLYASRTFAGEIQLPMDHIGIPEVPLDALEFHFRVRIEDETGNRAEFEEEMYVLDGTPPELELSYSPPMTSHIWELTVNASDNRRLNRTWLEYSFDGGPVSSRLLDVGGKTSFPITEDTRIVRIAAFAEDSSDLVASVVRSVEVWDGTPPSIAHSSFMRLDGDMFEFTLDAIDNREVSKAWIVLHSSNGHDEEVIMEGLGDGTFGVRIPRSRLEDYNDYCYIVEDSSGLKASSEPFELCLEGSGKGQGVIAVAFILLFTILLVIAVVILLMLFLLRKGRPPLPGRHELIATGTDVPKRPRELLPPPMMKRK